MKKLIHDHLIEKSVEKLKPLSDWCQIFSVKCIDKIVFIYYLSLSVISKILSARRASIFAWPFSYAYIIAALPLIKYNQY